MFATSFCHAAALLSFTFAFSPRTYSIQDRSIVVKRLIGNVTIPLEGIREARAATSDDLRGAICGDNGVCGAAGGKDAHSAV